jgi:hypothetical protein
MFLEPSISISDNPDFLRLEESLYQVLTMLSKRTTFVRKGKYTSSKRV